MNIIPAVPKFPFPEGIDNSALSAFKKCPLSWAYAHGRKLAPAQGSIHLHAGAAFAKGLEVARREYFDNGQDPFTAQTKGVEALIKSYGDFDAGDNDKKTCEKLIEALADYFIQYPLETNPVRPLKLPNGTHCVEFDFAVPLDIPHPETGNPILYTGRFDMLGEYEGALYGVDEKTASQLGQQWMNNWDLDSQFTGYTWAVQQYNYPIVGFFVRGISLLKNGCGHAQKITYRSQYQIDRWLASTKWYIQQMIDLWRLGQYPSALDKSACNSYGGCAFKSPCESPSPEQWLSHYVINDWSPLKKD